ncbi:ABC transporter permease [Dactylosporangium sp. CA-233914]|uniref:ABC transporter permease n=1 Tax=Dactylosporangium sp. CA-233914 TaxID=3239934 RepID=UPI003D9409EC
MLTFVLRRLVSGVAALFVTSSVTFFLLYFSSSSVARNILGESATSSQVHQKEIELGLDQPLISRYLSWLRGLLHGDLGTSWFTSGSVAGNIASRLSATLSIVAVAVIVTAVVSTLVGVTAAVRRGWTDRVLQVLSIGGAAVPQFLVGIVLVTVFAIRFGLFPATGYVPLAAGVRAWSSTMTLPVVALAIGGIASMSQQVRSAAIAALAKDYVRTLRSRGLSPREVIFRHVLRDAAPAALTVLSLQFIGLLGGVVVIEQIFALPGIGYLALQSATQGDMPMLMGVVVYTVLVVVAVNLLVDLAVAWLNPRVRIS